MLLKTYLKSLYGISEEYAIISSSVSTYTDRSHSKCSKYVSGKKTTVGDKLANKRNGEPISWDRLPFATHFLTADEMNKQKSCVSPQVSHPVLVSLPGTVSRYLGRRWTRR